MVYLSIYLSIYATVQNRVASKIYIANMSEPKTNYLAKLIVHPSRPVRVTLEARITSSTPQPFRRRPHGHYDRGANLKIREFLQTTPVPTESHILPPHENQAGGPKRLSRKLSSSSQLARLLADTGLLGPSIR